MKLLVKAEIQVEKDHPDLCSGECQFLDTGLGACDLFQASVNNGFMVFNRCEECLEAEVE